MPEIPTNMIADVLIVVGHKNLSYRQGRINTAIDVFLQRRAGTMLLCGGAGEATEMAQIAQQAGIPAKNIVLEQQSATTFENALFSKAFIKQRHWQSAIIVSDGYHLARLWLCFRKSGLKRIQLISTPFPNNFSARCRWLMALLRENIALPYYLLKTTKL